MDNISRINKLTSEKEKVISIMDDDDEVVEQLPPAEDLPPLHQEPEPIKVEPQPVVKQEAPKVQETAPSQPSHDDTVKSSSSSLKVVKIVMGVVATLTVCGMAYGVMNYVIPLIPKKSVTVPSAPVVAPATPSKVALAKEGLEFCSRMELKKLDEADTIHTYIVPKDISTACSDWAKSKIYAHKPEVLEPGTVKPVPASAPVAVVPTTTSMTFSEMQNAFRTACVNDKAKIAPDELWFSESFNPIGLFLKEGVTNGLSEPCATFINKGRYIVIKEASIPVAVPPPVQEVAPVVKPVAPIAKPVSPKPVAKPKPKQDDICFSCDAEKFMNN